MPFHFALYSTCLCASPNDQEFILPLADNYIVENPNDLEGKSELAVNIAFDSKGVNYQGKAAIRKDLLVKEFKVIFPGKLGKDHLLLQAKEARYVPSSDGPGPSGGWLLTGATPAA